MLIVIVDSGVSKRYEGCNEIVFPICSDEGVPPITSGHGTAVYNIISRKCSEYAKIINFRIVNIENDIEDEILIDAFDSVIGVVTGSSCSKIDDFEFFEDSIVNIGAKGNLQRVLWDNPPTVFLSGNSFACVHVTSKMN